MTTLALTGLEPSAQITISSAARLHREEILMVGEPLARLAKINGPRTYQEVVDAMRALNGMEKEVEKARKEVKAPLIKLGKDLDAKAAEFIAPVETLKAQLAKLATAYELGIEKARKERERQAAEEARKIEEERLRIEKEQARLAAEAEKAAQAGDATKAEELSDTLFALEVQAEEAALSTPSTLAITEDKPQGVSVRTKLDFEIIGANEFEQRKSLIKLFGQYPELVKLEAIRSSILDRLNRDRFGFPEDVTPQVPGLRIFETTQRRFS